VKRTSLKDFRNINRSGIIAVSLNEDDSLKDVIYTTGDDDVLLSTAGGMAIRFNEQDVRVMGRNAAGVRGIALRDDDHMVGAIRASESEADLLTVTENGYGKRTPLDEYLVRSEDGSTRPQSRGGKGRLDIRTNDRNGPVAAIRWIRDGDGVVIVSESGMIVRVPAESISRMGRNTQGVRLVNLRAGDRVIAVARVPESESESERDGEASDAPPGDDAAAGSGNGVAPDDAAGDGE